MMVVAYSDYRLSDAAWVERIPAHWRTSRLRYVARIGNGTTPSRDRFDYWSNGTVPWLASGQVNDYIVRKARELVTLQAVRESSLRVLPAGSVILGMVGQGKTRGMSAYLAIDATINQNLAGITPTKELDGRYLHYMLTTAYDFQRNYGRGGNQAALNCAIVGSFPALLPPRPEQDQIVAYLRAQDAHIARFIKAKRELIKLLTEQKLRIIDHAVTRGLDESVALKPSGIEWLGEVPEHWKALKLKFATKRIVGGSTPKSDESSYWDGGIVWVTPRDISKTDSLHTSLRTISAAGLQSCASTLVPPGSIVITSRAPVGNVAIARVELCTNQGCKAVVPAPDIAISDFLFLLLLRMKERLQVLANGTTFAEIGTWVLANEFIPVPPVSEQHAICRWITDECQPLDDAIARTEEEIKLIREYRDRLIADVVTGQVDVRGWQPGPDDAVSDDDLAALGEDEAEPAEEDGDGEEN
ncbi:MAG: restriction endonuclease subunit S [Sinobacteraceae bacterium]|nr:restriction endonuclease subunit S [Nevskiaceae bacterium]MCP5471401.1 restriction endonuclease subunit S [Nevskiaceae bacterium]